MNERRPKKSGNNPLSAEEIAKLIEQLQNGDHENLYTYALLEGTEKLRKRTDLVISFYPDLRNPKDIIEGRHLSDAEEERIMNEIVNLDISDQTQFIPRIGSFQQERLANEIQERHLPTVILEYGTVLIRDIEVPKKYILLYHTIDMSTGNALQKIKSVIF